MNNKKTNNTANEIIEIPKVFWKYYDLYRRGMISVEEYSRKSNLAMEEIVYYLSVV